MGPTSYILPIFLLITPWKHQKTLKFSDAIRAYRNGRSNCLLMFFKIGVLKDFSKITGKRLCQSLFFNKRPHSCNFIKKETSTQVFSCESCDIFKSTFFIEHFRNSRPKWLKEKLAPWTRDVNWRYIRRSEDVSHKMMIWTRLYLIFSILKRSGN